VHCKRASLFHVAKVDATFCFKIAVADSSLLSSIAFALANLSFALSLTLLELVTVALVQVTFVLFAV
jgi:hypothetical protein